MHGGHMKFGGSINRAQWTVGGDWLACIAIHFLVSCLCWPSLWCERHRCELLLLFLLVLDSLDGWLMQIWPSPDHSFYVVPPLLVNQTSELDFWYNLEAFVSGLSCSWEWEWWFPDKTFRICSKESFLNRSICPLSFHFYYLWLRWVVKRLKI